MAQGHELIDAVTIRIKFENSQKKMESGLLLSEFEMKSVFKYGLDLCFSVIDICKQNQSLHGDIAKLRKEIEMKTRRISLMQEELQALRENPSSRSSITEDFPKSGGY